MKIMAEVGAAPSVISVMDAHGSQPGIQEDACHALATLSQRACANRAMLSLALGIPRPAGDWGWPPCSLSRCTRLRLGAALLLESGMDDSLLRAQARRRCQQETRQPGKGRGSARARDAGLRGSRAAAGGGVRCAGKLGRRRRRLQAGGCGCDGSIGDVPCDGRASRLGRGAAAGLSRAAQPLHRRGQVRAGRDGRQGRQDGSRCDAAPPCRPRRAVARRPIRRTKRPRIGPWPRCPIRTASRPQQPEIPRLWQAPHDSLPLASTCRLPCTRQRRMRPVGRASGGAIGFGGGGSLRDDADAHRAAAPAGGLSGPRVYRGLASFQKGSHVSGWLAAVAWGATALLLGLPGACARNARLLLSRRRAMQTTRSRFGPPTRQRWSSRPCATFRCRTTCRKLRSVCLSAYRKATPNASRQ